MPNHDQEESNDPVWALLSRSAKLRISSSFSLTMVGRVQSISQDSPAPPGIRQLFASAPVGWQAAAAAILLVSTSVGLLGLLADPDPAGLSTTVEKDMSIAIADWDSRDDSPAHLSPLDDILATDELDKILQIEDADSLESETFCFCWCLTGSCCKLRRKFPFLGVIEFLVKNRLGTIAF